LFYIFVTPNYVYYYTMKIGAYFRKQRVILGYSQEYAAEILKISQKTYSNIENDRNGISFETVKRSIVLFKIDITSEDFKRLLDTTKKMDQYTQTSYINIDNSFKIISEKLIAQMEERIEELKNKVIYLEKINLKLQSSVFE